MKPSSDFYNALRLIRLKQPALEAVSLLMSRDKDWAKMKSEQKTLWGHVIECRSHEVAHRLLDAGINPLDVGSAPFSLFANIIKINSQDYDKDFHLAARVANHPAVRDRLEKRMSMQKSGQPILPEKTVEGVLSKAHLSHLLDHFQYDLAANLIGLFFASKETLTNNTFAWEIAVSLFKSPPRATKRESGARLLEAMAVSFSKNDLRSAMTSAFLIHTLGEKHAEDVWPMSWRCVFVRVFGEEENGFDPSKSFTPSSSPFPFPKALHFMRLELEAKELRAILQPKNEDSSERAVNAHPMRKSRLT